MTSRPDLATRVALGMRSFANRMESLPELEDAILTTRIVGEFSAGKTRVLRELLGDAVPDALAPISSRDAQTRLPLEVTYGPAPLLEVIERRSDGDQGKHIEELDRFPTRGEIDARGYLLEQHRLRLSLPMEQMILRQGDQYHDQSPPARMFLIDMPGWNSPDDKGADILLGAEYSLALVYVANAIRLDGVENRKHLRNFITALKSDEDLGHFSGSPRLLMVVTQCAPADATRLSIRAREIVDELVVELWGESDMVTLDILCVDFDKLSDAERVTFRQRFWQFLLTPLEQEQAAHPWQARIGVWPAGHDIRPRLEHTRTLLAGLRTLARRACTDGQFLKDMNRRRLEFLPDEEITLKLREAWRKKVDPAVLADAQGMVKSLLLPQDHPLSDWWNDIWCGQVHAIVTGALDFASRAETALNAIDCRTEDPPAFLQQALHAPYDLMQRALTSSFARLIDATQAFDTQPLDQLIPTLFVLSTVQGQYEKHFAQHVQTLSQERTDGA